MKQALLPIALLALSLPGAALAHPITVIYAPPGYQPGLPMTGGYRNPYALRPSVQAYGVTPGPTAIRLPVTSYGVTGGYGVPGGYRGPGGYGNGYGNPTVSYGYGGSQPIYDYNRSAPSYSYRQPLPYGVAQVPPTVRTCGPNPGRVLMGAALGGLTTAVLAPNPQTRTWAVPVGAALGGLGGLATGC